MFNVYVLRGLTATWFVNHHYYNAPTSKPVLPSTAQTRYSTGLKIYTCIALTLAGDQKVFLQPS